MALGKPQQEAADTHEPNSHGDPGPARLRFLGHLQADWPANLKKAGENEVHPTHLFLSYLLAGDDFGRTGGQFNVSKLSTEIVRFIDQDVRSRIHRRY